MRQHISMYAGDSKYLIIFITDEEGKALDISGASFIWKMKDVTKAGIISDAEQGEIIVKLEPKDTEGLSSVLPHEVEMTDAAGNVSTVFHDFITINQPIIKGEDIHG